MRNMEFCFLIKWVPGISGNLMGKSKLPPRSGSRLEAVAPHIVSVMFLSAEGDNFQSPILKREKSGKKWEPEGT